MKTLLGVGLLVVVVEYCHGGGAKMPQRPNPSIPTPATSTQESITPIAG
jgi:hypothetical protein